MLDVGLTLRQAQPLRKAPSQTQPPRPSKTAVVAQDGAAAAGAAAAGAAEAGAVAPVGAATSQQRPYGSRSSRRRSRSRRRRSRSRRSSRSRSRRRRKRGDVRSRSRRRRKRDEADEAEAAAEAGDAAAVAAAENAAEEPPPEAAENAAEEPPQEAGEGNDGGVDEAEVAEDLLALQDVKEEIHSPAEEGVHGLSGEPLQALLAPARARRKAGLARPPLPFLPFGLLPPGTVVEATRKHPQAVPPGRVHAKAWGPAPPKTRPPGARSSRPAPTTPQRTQRVPIGSAASDTDTVAGAELEADPPWRANWRSRGWSHDDSELNDEDGWGPSWKAY
jgi:hypothetical protein